MQNIHAKIVTFLKSHIIVLNPHLFGAETRLQCLVAKLCEMHICMPQSDLNTLRTILDYPEYTNAHTVILCSSWHASIHLQLSTHHWRQLGTALLAFSDCDEGVLRVQKQCEGPSFSDTAPGTRMMSTGYSLGFWPGKMWDETC